MTKEKIFIDIDEVASRTIEDGVYPIVNRDFGTNFTFETTTSYRDVFGDALRENGKPINLQRKIEIFNGVILTDRGKNLIRPVQGSVDKILELSKRFDIGMLTARHPMLFEYTNEWVGYKFHGVVGHIFFSNCCHGGNVTKSKICKQEGVKIMIEDDMDYSL